MLDKISHVLSTQPEWHVLGQILFFLSDLYGLLDTLFAYLLQSFRASIQTFLLIFFFFPPIINTFVVNRVLSEKAIRALRRALL